MRFGENPIVECSADFVGKRLPPPDDWEGGHGEVLIYRQPRDAYLKASPDAIDIPVLTPFGEETICAIKGIEDLMHRYRRMIRECRQAEDGEVSTALSAVIDFAAQSGLIPRVRRGVDNAHKSGSRLV